MNNKLQNFFDEAGFTYQQNHGVGVIRGYEVNVSANNLAGCIAFISTKLLPKQEVEVEEALKLKKLKLVKCKACNFGVNVEISGFSLSTILKKANGILDTICATLEELGAPKKDICPLSGEVLTAENSTCVNIPGTQLVITVSKNYADEMFKTIEKAKAEEAAAPNNYLKGFLGILIGAVAGVILTVVLSLVGFVSVWSSLLGSILGIVLYKKFGGKENAVMIVMSVLTTSILILGTIFLLYINAANTICAEAGYSAIGFEALQICLEKSNEFSQAFTQEMLYNVAFIALGQVYSVMRVVRARKDTTRYLKGQ